MPRGVCGVDHGQVVLGRAFGLVEELPDAVEELDGEAAVVGWLDIW
jgi:hypothetical protein